ncbi:MAG: transcription elongation factor GreA [Planctomycetes bacterium]|nr:transcription elongation factor GreA [Planctomycetota bacterium]
MEYLSAEEKSRLESQLKKCDELRRVISKRIETAREMGDLRENAEYHAAREDQGLNEAKIRELEHRLSNAVVADTETVPPDMVFVGATVRLRNVETGDEDLYRLVGDATGAVDDEFIEVTPNSPLGEALMKSHVGEVVRVNLRRGPKRFEIVEITE